MTGIGEQMRHQGKDWEVVRVNIPTQGVQPGKYLLDPQTHEVAYLVDPGIGGRVREIDGKPITKLDSPKATIMALVTDGILTQRLPWGLVLIGVFLTFAIELMGLSPCPSRSESTSRSRLPARCSSAGRCAGWWSGDRGERNDP